MTSGIAVTPQPPYYAVIFTSRLKDDEGYAEMADKMFELASRQAGYLGFESARDGLGISVSYWSDLESIRKWKAHVAHLHAQKLGQEKWYSCYSVRIALVEHEYGINRNESRGE